MDAGPDAGAAADLEEEGLRSEVALPMQGAWPEWASARSVQNTAVGRRVVRGQRFSFAFWDSRELELVLVPGRVDPGGSGVVPPALRPRLIAAFNGGFRSVHGHYGLRAEGRTFAPARAGLATLAEAADGGWWLGVPTDRAPLPEDLRSFRQNLPPLLEAGQFDPTGKASFGALAPGKHAGRTTRSALGLRHDGVFVYAYGIDVTPEELAEAMTEAGAGFGMALDINDGQAGFEWLEVGDEAAGRPRPAAHSAMQAEWTGIVRGRRVHAERLSTPMGTPLPRWVFGDPRDHFVLTRKALPGPPAQLGMPPAGPRKEK